MKCFELGGDSLPYHDKVLPHSMTRTQHIMFWGFIGLASALVIGGVVLFLLAGSSSSTLMTINVTGLEIKSIEVIDQEGSHLKAAVKKVTSSTWQARAGSDYGPKSLRFECKNGQVFWVQYFASNTSDALRREFYLSYDSPAGKITCCEYETSSNQGRIEVANGNFDPAATSEQKPFTVGRL